MLFLLVVFYDLILHPTPLTAPFAHDDLHALLQLLPRDPKLARTAARMGVERWFCLLLVF
jgi:hypothetical protein